MPVWRSGSAIRWRLDRGGPPRAARVLRRTPCTPGPRAVPVHRDGRGRATRGRPRLAEPPGGRGGRGRPAVPRLHRQVLAGRADGASTRRPSSGSSSASAPGEQPRGIQMQVKAISSEWVEDKGLPGDGLHPRRGRRGDGSARPGRPRRRCRLDRSRGHVVDADLRRRRRRARRMDPRRHAPAARWVPLLDGVPHRLGLLAFRDQGYEVVSLSGAPLARSSAGRRRGRPRPRHARRLPRPPRESRSSRTTASVRCTRSRASSSRRTIRCISSSPRRRTCRASASRSVAPTSPTPESGTSWRWPARDGSEPRGARPGRSRTDAPATTSAACRRHGARDGSASERADSHGWRMGSRQRCTAREGPSWPHRVLGTRSPSGSRCRPPPTPPRR